MLYYIDDDYGSGMAQVIRDAVVDHRTGRIQPYQRRLPASRMPVVVRRPQPAIPVRTVPAPAPVVEDVADVGLTIGGMNIPLSTIAGALLTLAGLGTTLVGQFVTQPEPPEPERAQASDIAAYEQEKAKAEKRMRRFDAIGRSLSDLGQMAAFRMG